MFVVKTVTVTRQNKHNVFVVKNDNTSGELVDGWTNITHSSADARIVALALPINECPMTLLNRKGNGVQPVGRYKSYFGIRLKILTVNNIGGQDNGIADWSVIIGDY